MQSATTTRKLTGKLTVSCIPLGTPFRLTKYPERIYRPYAMNASRVSCDVLNNAQEVVGRVEIRANAEAMKL